MPIDPNISLGVRVPQPTAANSGLGMLGSFALIQNQLNTARLFQLEMAGRIRAGELMANAPNVDAGLAAIQQDPIAMAGAPQIANYIRQMQLTEAQIGQSRQTQVQSALGAFLKSLPMAANNPAALPDLVRSSLAQLPPGVVTQQAADAMGDIVHGLLGGTSVDAQGQPVGPVQAADKFKANMTGAMAVVDPTGGMARSVYGTPGILDVGGYKIPYVQPPPGMGPGLALGTPTPMSLAPGMFKGPGGIGIPYGATGAAPAGAAPAGVPGTAGAGLAPAATDMSGAPFTNIPKMPMISGLGGSVPASPGLITSSEGAVHEFNTSGLKSFDMAVSTKGSLQEIRSDFDNLMNESIDPKTGQRIPNWFALGTAGEARTRIAKAVNTAALVAGFNPVFDTGKQASAEDLIKATTRLGVQYTSQMLGQQREAMLTIQRLTAAQPNIANAYASGMLITDMVEAGTDRQIDWRNFQAETMKQNSGYLPPDTQSRFNVSRPISWYIDKKFDLFARQMDAARSSGHISNSEALDVMKLVQTARQDALKGPPAAAAGPGP